MQVRCYCGRLASSLRACKVCGSDNPMRHTHCDEMHVMPSGSPEIDAQRHTIYNCALSHMHPHEGFHDHAATGEMLLDGPLPSIPFAEREAWLLSMPWVSRVRGSVPCDGVCWSKSSMKTRVGCKKRGKYRYRPLKASWVSKGNFCWVHLPVHDQNEEMRIDRWRAKNPPPWTRGVILDDRDAADRRTEARDEGA